MTARPPIDGATAVVTGASSGIGREIARLLAPRVRALVLVARRADRLRALARELEAAHPALEVRVAPCDLADEAATAALAATLAATPVDLLVAAAGVGDHALYDRSDWARVRAVIAVDALAVAALVHALAPGMVARRRGGILVIGSFLGRAWLPGAAAYVGAKHFVDGFVETLRLDLRDTGVAVTQACPGPVATGFDEAALIDHAAIGSDGAWLRLDAARCARDALAAFSRGAALAVPGWRVRLLMRLHDALPRPVRRRIAAGIARRLRAR